VRNTPLASFGKSPYIVQMNTRWANVLFLLPGILPGGLLLRPWR